MANLEWTILCLIFLEVSSVPLQEKFIATTMRGTWSREMEDNIFLIPQVKSGFRNIGISFFNSVSSSIDAFIYEVDSEQKTETWVFLRLLDEQYVNKKAIEIEFPLLQGYNSQTNSWLISKTYLAAALFQNLEPLVKFDFKADVEINELQSEQGLEIKITSDSLKFESKLFRANPGLGPFLKMGAINLVQLGLLLYFGKIQRVLFNTSEWLILHNTCFFVVQSLFMAKVALQNYDTSLSYLGYTALVNIVVLFLLLSKFEAVLQKFKNRDLFIKGIIFTLAYFALTHAFFTSPFTWVVDSMIFLWQIGHSARHGGSGGVSIELVLVVLLSRIPLIFILVDNNILRYAPNNSAAVLIMGILFFHLVIIFLQNKFGSRIFIPKLIIPDFYEYRNSTLANSDNSKIECSICLNELRESPDAIPTEGEKTIDEMSSNNFGERIFYALTPCMHYYHMKCLGDWLKAKLTCPLCKRGLPPMSSIS